MERKRESFLNAAMGPYYMLATLLIAVGRIRKEVRKLGAPAASVDLSQDRKSFISRLVHFIPWTTRIVLNIRTIKAYACFANVCFSF